MQRAFYFIELSDGHKTRLALSVIIAQESEQSICFLMFTFFDFLPLQQVSYVAVCSDGRDFSTMLEVPELDVCIIAF